MNLSVIKVSLLYFIIFISLKTIPAQSLNFQTMPSDKKQFSISFEKPFYSNNEGQTATSGVYQLSFNIPVSKKFNIKSEIPYININFDRNYGYGFYTNNQKGLGNIYIGLQTAPQSTEDKKKIISFGIF